MAQPPAVVIIARHGPRLDAADQSWHLSTPTPYDPPLTYGGWGQCRSLGVRIASILHAREQSFDDEHAGPTQADGVTSQDFAQPGHPAKRGDVPSEAQTRKRKRRHKVVIHTSPFTRCLQTSVAIAAGMAQFQAPEDAVSKSSVSPRPRTPNRLHSASPRLRGVDGTGSPGLAPIPEPKRDFAHAIARKVLHEHRRHRKSGLRVDAFLGEWLNPQYFDHITPPPPSPMMVAAAKAELLQNDTIDIFTPTMSPKSSGSSLWGGASPPKGHSRNASLEDCSPLDETPLSTARRDRSSSVSSVGSTDSGSRRRSPFRTGHASQHFVSTVPKPETTLYVPPAPQYAVSASDGIPRGYVTHARQACTSVDYQWDSSRPPQDWGDGGEYGEEWSAMHKRFRKGLNHLISWYSEHNADDRGEDALGFEQAEKHHEDEEEDLVVVLVTHGAGSNALIGALTGQPVLLDVGMASLTMAVRRDDAPPLTIPSMDGDPRASPSEMSNTHGHPRKGSQLDLGLNSAYEMKLISSTEHLRPGADPTRVPSISLPRDLRSGVYTTPQSRQRLGPVTHAAAGAGIESTSTFGEPARGSSNSNLGSMRRPSMISSVTAPAPSHLAQSMTMPADAPPASGNNGPGLWTPPTSNTPLIGLQKPQDERADAFSQWNDTTGRVSPGQDLVLDFSTSPPDSRPTSSSGPKQPATVPPPRPTTQTPLPRKAIAMALDGTFDDTADDIVINNPNHSYRGSISEMPRPETSPPASVSRSLSQRGLWGSRPGGDQVAKSFPVEPKRRWTVSQDDAAAH